MHNSITLIFENNMANRITSKLAGGMVCSLVDILTAGLLQPAYDDSPVEGNQGQRNGKEGWNGLV